MSVGSLHFLQERVDIHQACDLQGSREHRGVGEILAQRRDGNLAGVDRADSSLVASQHGTDLFRALRRVDDDGTAFFQTCCHIDVFDQGLIYDHDIVGVVDVGMYTNRLITDSVVSSDRRAHSFRTVFGETLYFGTGGKANVSQKQSRRLGALASAAMPSDFS